MNENLLKKGRKKIYIFFQGKLLRSSKYEEEISEGQLGMGDRELHSMNKHIPGEILFLNLKISFTFIEFSQYLHSIGNRSDFLSNCVS